MRCLVSQMGCLPSRTTTVSPVESAQSSGGGGGGGGDASSRQQLKQVNGHLDNRKRANGTIAGSTKQANGRILRPTDNNSDSGPPATGAQEKLVGIGTSFERDERPPETEEEDEDLMSILINEDEEDDDEEEVEMSDTSNNTFRPSGRRRASEKRVQEEEEKANDDMGAVAIPKPTELVATSGSGAQTPTQSEVAAEAAAVDAGNNELESTSAASFDEELNVDLLRQYIAIDYEISQLEDRDALRLYHEKIEQLEQLERELDMISFEAEEMAVRSDHTGNNATANASIRSAGTEASMTSTLLKSAGGGKTNSGGGASKNKQKANNNKSLVGTGSDQQIAKSGRESAIGSAGGYSSIEDVFSRKIILEKERDKLKKEVEMVIVECDRLQQRYKRRDEILDKLFDGRTGNGLENHLEQQLNWLMEQKHYVDQVFYAWKRAETLTSQTCEQFASALELLKRLAKLRPSSELQGVAIGSGSGSGTGSGSATTDDERQELAKGICELLTKSRQDMEQAQRYNPNVDAPFFTDAETERFDRIIEQLQPTTSGVGSISQAEFNQMATVVQFAYKRAVSIRLWLEQILQITIARDSFELAEEYKWIAIQLRKERISLINSKLQEPQYRTMAASIRSQMARQQIAPSGGGASPSSSKSTHDHRHQMLAITNGHTKPEAGELPVPAAAAASEGDKQVNRDSGVDSDDIDIEEDIYRLLEMNKSRLQAAVAASRQAGLPATPTALDSLGRPVGGVANGVAMSPASAQSRDRLMRERIARRVEMGGAAGAPPPPPPPPTGSASSSATPSKLRVELDELARQNLLKQVDQMHARHRTRLDTMRGHSKTRAENKLRQQQQQQQTGSAAAAEQI